MAVFLQSFAKSDHKLNAKNYSQKSEFSRNYFKFPEFFKIKINPKNDRNKQLIKQVINYL